MNITIDLTRSELKEMNVSPDELKDKILVQLDEATTTSGKAAIELVGYNVFVNVSD